MFCTACPAAPFTRLSIAPIMMIRWVLRIDLEIYVHIVAAFHPFGLGADVLIQHADELFLLIIFIVCSLHFLIGNVFFEGSVSGDEDASVHGNQMRGEV